MRGLAAALVGLILVGAAALAIGGDPPEPERLQRNGVVFTIAPVSPEMQAQPPPAFVVPEYETQTPVGGFLTRPPEPREDVKVEWLKK
jgi:hypothetical protein